MAILIGVDEAGYGPHLGPLAVAATAWRVEPREEAGGSCASRASGQATDALMSRRARSRSVPAEHDLYKLLRKAVVRLPGKQGRRLAIADSKALYKSGFGLAQLERGVLAGLALSARQRRGGDGASS